MRPKWLRVQPRVAGSAGPSVPIERAEPLMMGGRQAWPKVSRVAQSRVEEVRRRMFEKSTGEMDDEKRLIWCCRKSLIGGNLSILIARAPDHILTASSAEPLYLQLSLHTTLRDCPSHHPS